MAWVLLGALVLAQIAYPLTEGDARAGLTVATVLLGYLLSVSHALFTRGPRAATALVATATPTASTAKPPSVAVATSAVAARGPRVNSACDTDSR